MTDRSVLHDTFVIERAYPATASRRNATCRLRHRPETPPVGYAIDTNSHFARAVAVS